MGIGAHDYIDQALVKKYSTVKVDNHDGINSMVSAEKMMSAMSDYASVSRNMFAMSKKLSAACSALNSMSVKYKSSLS